MRSDTHNYCSPGWSTGTKCSALSATVEPRHARVLRNQALEQRRREVAFAEGAGDGDDGFTFVFRASGDLERGGDVGARGDAAEDALGAGDLAGLAGTGAGGGVWDIVPSSAGAGTTAVVRLGTVTNLDTDDDVAEVLDVVLEAAGPLNEL